MLRIKRGHLVRMLSTHVPKLSEAAAIEPEPVTPPEEEKQTDVPQYVKEKYGQKYLDRLLAKSNFHVGHNTLYSDYRNKFIRNPKLADDPMYEYNHMPFDHFKYGRSNNRFSDRKNAKKANTNIKLSEHKLMRKMNENFQIVSNLEPYASEIDITENPLVKIENDW